MKHILVCISLIFLIIFGSGAEISAKEDFPVLKGPYLGQKPPGITPEIFAPGLITTHYSQSYIAFLHEARVCVYSASTEKGHETYYTYEKNGRWTRPLRAPFEELQGHPNYTSGPLGQKVYFHSGRKTHPNDIRQDDNIWAIEWTDTGWAEPQALPEPANSEYGEAYPSAATDGTVYFFTWKRTGTRGYDIWGSKCINGKYREAERLPWPINTDFIEYDPYVSPDQSFLIFGSTRPGGYGKSDNYICFRKEDGSWTFPVNLGSPINSSSYDLCANGTPDGKYFFFLSGRKTDVYKGEIGKKPGQEPGDDSDLYWVSFSFINELKKTLITKQNAAEIIKLEYKKNGVQSAVHRLKILYSDQKDSTYFPPYELLYLSKIMLAEDKIGDADLFVSILCEVLPEDLLIKQGYACFCILNGFVSKGLKIFEELEAEDQDIDLSASLSSLGYLFTLYPDKTEDALSFLQFIVKKFPEDWFPYYSLARIHRKLGNLDKAIKNCRKALKIRASVGDVSQLLERLLEEKKQEQTQKQKEAFSLLKGSYLGQKPPGMVPKVFAAGILSSEGGEFNSAFSLDGNAFFYSITNKEKKKDQIMVMRKVDNVWTKPGIASFSGEYDDCDISISPRGDRFFFISSGRKLPDESMPLKRNYLWFVESTEKGLSIPRLLEYPGNVGGVYPVSTSDGTLYFSTRLKEGFGKADVYRSQLVNGSYAVPENLGKSINSKYNETDAFIDPDEKFIIVTCWERPENIGGVKSDLYISYSKKDGSWTPLCNMGRKINTEFIEFCPLISPDAKYFFFSSDRIDQSGCNIYWVDARIIDELKLKKIK